LLASKDTRRNKANTKCNIKKQTDWNTMTR